MPTTIKIVAAAMALGAAGCTSLVRTPPGADGAEAACGRLAVDYAFHRDRFDAEGVAGVFARDGTLELFGQTYAGRDAVRTRIQAMAGGAVIRHLVSNVRVVMESQSVAAMTSYVQVIQAPAGSLPAAHPGVSTIGEYHDRCVNTLEGWRLASRKLILVMTPPGS